LLEHVLRARACRSGEFTVEFGVFVAYTTMRIGQRVAEDMSLKQHALNARKEGLHSMVVGLEVEPVHVCVARWMLDIAHLSQLCEVWSGIAHDLLFRVGDEFGVHAIRLAFMDHRGTKFHEDLLRLEQNGLLMPGAKIVADNVLKPSAPAFVWMVNNSCSYKTVNWAVGEFVQYNVEDWMVVCDYWQPNGYAPLLPAALRRLAWDSDKWRRKSEEDSVRISEWAVFAKHARQIFQDHGIEAKPWLN